jgi:hypothetical protein
MQRKLKRILGLQEWLGYLKMSELGAGHFSLSLPRVPSELLTRNQ